MRQVLAKDEVMLRSRRTYPTAILLIFAATIVSFPVGAQSVSGGLEALVGPSLEVESGLALARRQIADTDLLGALGTLERVQFAHPDALEPRFLYASLLCRLDDRQGAEVEISQLAGRAIADQAWAEVTAACGQVARPRPGKKK
jgi:hypothetical protein